jgi:hypothetical protein
MSFRDQNANAARLKTAIERRPFLLFGLPFMAIVVAGSFFLTPFTATRYELHDKKRKFVDKQDAIDQSGVKRRRFDAREEYYVRAHSECSTLANDDAETGRERLGTMGTEENTQAR